MKISVVTSLYHSAPHIQEFYNRTVAQILKITGDYEIIFVNDGSPDTSLKQVLALADKDNNIQVIDLTRNFGHHKAILTGLNYANGELIFLTDCDLEEHPELLSTFYSKMQTENCDVVYGIQRSRSGTWFEKISGNIAYKLVNALSGEKMPINSLVVRLMTKRYVENLLQHNETELYLAGLLHITGYVQVPVPVDKIKKGTTTYTLRKRISAFINAITSFSNKPLIYIFNIGVSILIFSVVYIFYLVANKIIHHSIISGWTSILVSIWFLGGLIISFLGIIGIYISKIYVETKNRPYTLIKHHYKF